MDFDPHPSSAQPFRFTPVPRHNDRADGWSSDRQHAFVWALARMPSVAVAARGVGMTARSAYRLRKAAGAEDFARAWDIAWQMGIDHVRDLAIERGLHGQDYPIHRQGRVVGTIHRCDNRLLLRTSACSIGRTPCSAGSRPPGECGDDHRAHAMPGQSSRNYISSSGNKCNRLARLSRLSPGPARVDALAINLLSHRAASF
jgi:hypothetical protein